MIEHNSDYKFSLWCFGEVWDQFLLGEKDVEQLFDAWNEIHGDLLLLDKDDIISESMAKMKALWKKQKEDKKMDKKPLAPPPLVKVLLGGKIKKPPVKQTPPPVVKLPKNFGEIK